MNTGSSARKLRRGQANLLPGRVHVHNLAPLLAREQGDEFDIDRALGTGQEVIDQKRDVLPPLPERRRRPLMGDGGQ